MPQEMKNLVINSRGDFMAKDLNMNLKQKQDNSQKVKRAKTKVKDVMFEPKWNEVWNTGYTTPTGKFKRGIFKYPLTNSEIEKLKEVKQAIENEEIGKGVENLKKYSKALALRQYQQLIDNRKDLYIKEILAHIPINYHLVITIEALNDLLVKLEQEQEISLDTETTGLKHQDRIVGISMTLPIADQHYYIPVRHLNIDQQLPANVVLPALKAFLEDATKGKILHNAKFDSHMFYKEGIDLKGITMDTMLAMHVLNENEPSYALKNLATKYGKYFGFIDKSWTYENLFGKGGFENTPLDIGHYYACKDTHLTYSLSCWIRLYFEEQPQLADAYGIENRTLHVAIAMEREGVLIDLTYAKQYALELKKQLDQMLEILTLELGIENINSNPQLLQALKSKGIVDKDTKSVGKNVLKPLKNKHKVIADLLEYRKLSKLYGTYIEPIPHMVRDTGRLHGNFNQHTTVTSRFSSDKPNLQNIPPKARGMFVPKAGYMFVGIDYSQIEPRFLSHVTKDTHFQEPYLNDKDLYAQLASKTFNCPIEECGDGTLNRKHMKVGLLATMYGITPFQLGESLGITTEDAEQFLQDFLDAYPVTAKWIESIHQLVQDQGYVELLGGRKRRFPEIKKIAKQYHSINNRLCKKLKVKEIKNIWITSLPYDEKRMYWDIAKQYHRVMRQSVNAIIQGSSATIMKMAMIALQDYIELNDLPYKQILTIHDEVILEVPTTVSRSDLEKLGSLMTSVITLDVPLKVDIEIMMDNWAEKISLDEWSEQYENTKN